MFNMAQYCFVDKEVLNKLESFTKSTWNPFSKEEFTSTLTKCNNLSTPSLNELAWRYLKHILKDSTCLKNIINITNMCFKLGYWPSYFKTSTTIVILKPNKLSYDSHKSFRPIVLLNTLGKLIKKVISDRLQFHTTSNNFIYQSQLGGLKFKSTFDTGIVLTHFIHMRWVRNLPTSTLAFDISQFFLSLNHWLLTLILSKVGLDPRVVKFFLNYLVGKRTQYFWNNFSFLFFNIDIGVGQESALSPILSAIYLALSLHILENYLKILKIPISILLFVDDGLLVAQSKSFSISNSLLFCSYNIISFLLSRFDLIVEHSKTEVFYFTRLHGSFNLPPLDLSFIGSPMLYPKDTWKYLRFIFDRKLLFYQHIDFYSNKAISTVKCIKILGNLVRGLIPHQKCLLYRSYILPIALYGFQL